MPSDPLYFIPKGIKSVTLDEDMTDGYNQAVLAEATGDLNVTYMDDTSHTYSIGATPAYLYGNFKKVNTASTTIAAANLFRIKMGIS